MLTLLSGLLQAKNSFAAATQPTPGYLSGSINAFEKQGTGFEAPSLLPSLMPIALSLAFVVLLIYLVLWAVKRWRSGQGISSGREAEALIQVLEKTWLDTQPGLVLVEMGGELYFLGFGQDISLLSRIDNPVLVAEIKERVSQKTGLLGFPERFDKIGSVLRREQWKKSKQDLNNQKFEIEQQISRLKPAKKKDRE